jgi:hypothetical protein
MKGNQDRAFGSWNLNLNFNIKKAKAAAAYLIEHSGGSQAMFYLIKMLYYADRTALINWGNSITGDSFASLQKGPIVSDIYNFLKVPAVGQPQSRNAVEWRESIGRRNSADNEIFVLQEVDQSVLSEREIEVLEQARLVINQIHGSIAKWLHDNCPEWQDPRGSSIPIDPSVILRLAGRSEEEINELEETNHQVAFLNSLMSTH